MSCVSVCVFVCVLVCVVSSGTVPGEPEIAQLVLFPTVSNFQTFSSASLFVHKHTHWALCTHTHTQMHTHTQRGRANTLQELDTGWLYKDSNISMCKEPGSNCLTVWLPLRALLSAAGTGRETKTLNGGHARREREGGVSRQQRSSVHHKAAQWPRYHPLCVFVCVFTIDIQSVSPC